MIKDVGWTLRQLWKPHRECRAYRRWLGAAVVLGVGYLRLPLPELASAALGGAYGASLYYGMFGIFEAGRARARRLKYLKAIGRDNLRLMPERFWGTYCDGEQFGVVRAWTPGVARELGLMNAREGWKHDAKYEDITVRRSA